MNIVVKLPDDISERILCFPLLHILNTHLEQKLKNSDKVEDAFQLHFITLSSGVGVLNLLPFHAYYHELKAEDLKTIFSVHRGCSQFRLTNDIDLFISMTDSLVDASIGKNIGAKERIGFRKSFNNWFLTKSKSRALGKHFSEQICELLELVFPPVSKLPIVTARELELPNLDYKNKNYFVLDLDIIGDSVNPLWVELFELVKGAHFVLTASKASSFDQELRISRFIKSCSVNNTYELYKFEDHIQFARIIGRANMFMSLSSELVLMSAYCSCPTIFLNQNYNFKSRGSQFLRGEVHNISIMNNKDASGFSKGFDFLISAVELSQKN